MSSALPSFVQILIDIATPDGRQTGLVQNSAVKCENLYTKLQRDMRKIGVMPPALMQKVNDALKASLELQ